MHLPVGLAGRTGSHPAVYLWISMKPNAVSLPASAKGTLTILGITALVGLTFWIAAALPYMTTTRENFGRFPDLFWDRRYVLWLHILGGTVAMFAGPVQIWLGLTRR